MADTSAPHESLPTEVVEALVPAVVASVTEVAALIPARPAEVLGRLSVPVDPAEERGRLLRHSPTDYPISRDWPHEGQSKVASAFDRLPATLVERILGSLELRIADLALDPPPPTAALAELAGPPSSAREFITIGFSGQSEASTALGWVGRLWPGATSLVEALARALAERPAVAARLRVGPDVTDEGTLVAAHGAAHLALATVTATAVLRATDPDRRPDPAGVVGVALGVAVRLLEDAALPSHYPDAQLARRRAEYRFGFHASGSAPAQNHQLALVEGEPPETVDFSANGLVVPVSDGVLVRTGTADGHVGLELRVAEDAPPDVETLGWDEVVEVSWTAPSGWAQFVGSGMETGTPPWPGDYRVRVYARGRDQTDSPEYFRFDVWPAPAAPQLVHKHFDLLGHRLRGDLAPERPEPPEAPHRWILKSSVQVAATITVVTGATVDDVLRGFDADPAHSMSLAARRQIYDIDPPCVAVTTVDGGVVAVEDNGWEGSTGPGLEALSRSGRAASVFWNVNAGGRLSFAQNGRLLASFEPGFGTDPDVPPEVAEALQGIDFEDYRDRVPKELAAILRFTGATFRKEDLERIEATDLVYPISRH